MEGIDASNTKWKEFTHKSFKNYGKVRIYDIPANYRLQTKIAVDKSNYKWLFRWDADFVAFDNGKDEIKRIMDDANKDDYHVVTCYVDNLEIIPFLHDVRTPQKETHSEKYLFSYYDKLTSSINPIPCWIQYIMSFRGRGEVRGLPRRMGYSPAPLFFKKHKMSGKLGLHLRTIKPWERVVEKKYQPYWTLMKQEEKKKYDYDLWKYVEDSCNPKERYREIIDELKNVCVPYDGPWPDIMIKYMENELRTKFENSGNFRVKLWSYLNRFGGNK